MTQVPLRDIYFWTRCKWPIDHRVLMSSKRFCWKFRNDIILTMMSFTTSINSEMIEHPFSFTISGDHYQAFTGILTIVSGMSIPRYSQKSVRYLRFLLVLLMQCLYRPSAGVLIEFEVARDLWVQFRAAVRCIVRKFFVRTFASRPLEGNIFARNTWGGKGERVTYICL